MSLPRTSFTLRRLLLEPIAVYTPYTPAIRHDFGAASCQLTTRRRPWAHQSRFASNDPKGTGNEKDPYKVLGVPRDVPQKGVQTAYYNEAKKLHPDASNEDRAKFQEVSPSCLRRLLFPCSRRARTSHINKKTFAIACSGLREDKNPRGENEP